MCSDNLTIPPCTGVDVDGAEVRLNRLQDEWEPCTDGFTKLFALFSRPTDEDLHGALPYLLRLRLILASCDASTLRRVPAGPASGDRHNTIAVVSGQGDECANL